MSFESHMTDTYTLRRYKLKQDEVGGPKEIFSNVAAETDADCRIETLSSYERLILGREGNVATHRMFVKSTVATTKDEILSGGVTYDVTSVEKAPGSTATHHYELILTKRD